MQTRKYVYNGQIIVWLPGVGVIRPGQVFESRYPLTDNPNFTPSNDEATPVGEVRSTDNVCAKCVRVTDVKIKTMDKKAKKKE